MTSVIPDHIRAARERLDPTMVGLTDALLEAIAPYLKEHAERIAALEASQAAFKYVGTWSAERKDYAKGNFCSHSGALWHCERNGTTARPGDGWRLAVKSGQAR